MFTASCPAIAARSAGVPDWVLLQLSMLACAVVQKKHSRIREMRPAVNSVLMRDINDAHVLDMIEHFRGSGHVLRFIEYMDVGTCNEWRRDLVVPSAELRARIQARWPLRALSANYGGEVAQRWEFVDGAGEIGFISSVSEPFCGDCTRARLSADGRLYTCLFANRGHDLLGPMRAGASDAELAALIAALWSARDDRYSEIRGQARDPRRQHVEMYEIGG